MDVVEGLKEPLDNEVRLFHASRSRVVRYTARASTVRSRSPSKRAGISGCMPHPDTREGPSLGQDLLLARRRCAPYDERMGTMKSVPAAGAAGGAQHHGARRLWGAIAGGAFALTVGAFLGSAFDFVGEKTAEKLFLPFFESTSTAMPGCERERPQPRVGEEHVVLSVSRHGEDCWMSSLAHVDPGEIVDVAMEWQNFTGSVVSDVTLRGYVGDYLSLVPASTIWRNTRMDAPRPTKADTVMDPASTSANMRTAHPPGWCSPFRWPKTTRCRAGCRFSGSMVSRRLRNRRAMSGGPSASPSTEAADLPPMMTGCGAFG